MNTLEDYKKTIYCRVWFYRIKHLNTFMTYRSFDLFFLNTEYIVQKGQIKYLKSRLVDIKIYGWFYWLM